MRRANLLGETEHEIGNAHLEVHPRLQHVSQYAHIAVLDVPTVFTQVHGNAVSTGFLGVQRGLDRVRVARTASLTQGGDVVDVHAEQNTIGLSHAWTP